MPEWTKAYKSANKYIVGLANVMNEATGGDSYTKGAIDFNPAKIEYMLNGYFGGVFGTIDKLSKTVETVTGNREYDLVASCWQTDWSKPGTNAPSTGL